MTPLDINIALVTVGDINIALVTVGDINILGDVV